MFISSCLGALLLTRSLFFSGEGYFRTSIIMLNGYYIVIIYTNSIINFIRCTYRVSICVISFAVSSCLEHDTSLDMETHVYGSLKVNSTDIERYLGVRIPTNTSKDN